MNRNLLILGIAGILLLLVLLRILRRDNNNTGPRAVYGPKGTDDLPNNMFKDLATKGYGRLRKGYYRIAGTPEKRIAKELYNELEQVVPSLTVQEYWNRTIKYNLTQGLLTEIINKKCGPGTDKETREHGGGWCLNAHKKWGKRLKDMDLELVALEIKKLSTLNKKEEPKVEEFRNLNEFADDNLDILKNNKCYPGCCPGTYSCDQGCVCMTSAQKEFVGNHRGGNRTQYDHNSDF